MLELVCFTFHLKFGANLRWRCDSGKRFFELKSIQLERTFPGFLLYFCRIVHTHTPHETVVLNNQWNETSFWDDKNSFLHHKLLYASNQDSRPVLCTYLDFPVRVFSFVTITPKCKTTITTRAEVNDESMTFSYIGLTCNAIGTQCVFRLYLWNAFCAVILSDFERS